MPHRSAKPLVTAEDLKEAISLRDELDKFEVFEGYSKQKPGIDAIPFLRLALSEGYHGTVKCAADSLRKLGPSASDAVEDLLVAAAQIDPVFEMPQCYPECISALVAIQPSNHALVPLIRDSIDLDNWIDIKASLLALKVIGTPDAIELLRKIAQRWDAELSKSQKRVVDQLLSEIPT